MGGQFRNSGSLTDNNETVALIIGLQKGAVFGLIASGSEGTAGYNLISGSIESQESASYIMRGPSKPFVDGTAQENYFSQARFIWITGSEDKYQKDKAKREKTEKFSPR